jgi:hypothetical protein
MRLFISRLFLAASLLILLSPALATACPVCAGNRVDAPSPGRWMVYAATGAMLALPAGMVSVFIAWIRRNQ